MLVQALAAYADHYLATQLDDAEWETKFVPWLLEISIEGIFMKATPRMSQVERRKRVVPIPLEMNVPRSPVNRQGGHHPLLGSDDIAYVLGAGPWTPDKKADREKAKLHHKSFVDLIGSAAIETHDPALAACALFYANPSEVARARDAFGNAKAGSLIALSVDGPLVDRESVRSFWRRYYQEAFAERMGGSQGECLISGVVGIVAPTHQMIKGVSNLGGQATGVALMSFDKKAFRSYGWERNQNSPVCPDRALAYVLALNDLLRVDGGADGRRRRVDIAGIGFLCWLRDPTDFDPFEILDNPEFANVEALEKLQPIDQNANQFYMVGVSGNGGRLRVRYWVTDTLNQIKTNLRLWHDQLRIASPEGAPGLVSLWQLLYAIHPEGKPAPHLTLAVLRRAIQGPSQPLGYSVLSVILSRLRHLGDESLGLKWNTHRGFQNLRIPLGLVRLCVNDIHWARGLKEMSDGLDPSCNIPAYVCGRLMAEFENLQRASSGGELSSSVLDRFFSLASTSPAVAFPRIERLSLRHLHRLRRTNPGAAYAIDARIQELHSKLMPTDAGAYPDKLSIEGQGLFALGYYHQKTWSISQARDRIQSRPSAIESNKLES
jgi:CRISPR-associated protein Csd1